MGPGGRVGDAWIAGAAPCSSQEGPCRASRSARSRYRRRPSAESCLAHTAPRNPLRARDGCAPARRSAAIKRCTWLRLGSVTHAFDESQTFEELACKAAGSGELEITAPKLDNDSPGPLLFILNGAGVPSEGKVVFIG
ncbi:MAG TPA: galactose oxidase-like domain-containing protein [Thermoanaerobaculia bacterium]|jgi:hypothetical protein|nr:galactose oxidase-like domain-containing protein [Thermoanaerobaculia bacterium]